MPGVSDREGNNHLNLGENMAMPCMVRDVYLGVRGQGVLNPGGLFFKRRS